MGDKGIRDKNMAEENERRFHVVQIDNVERETGGRMMKETTDKITPPVSRSALTDLERDE